MKNPNSFLLDQDASGILTITLHRPDRLNALTFEVYRELTDTFAALRQEKSVRVVVITGSGRAFCSGGDVHDIIGELFKRDMEGLLDFTRLTCELVRNIRKAPQPVISSLNGTTAGAGACIALASDIRIASEAAKIAFLFVKVGLSGADMCFSRARSCRMQRPSSIAHTKLEQWLYWTHTSQQERSLSVSKSSMQTSRQAAL